MSDELIRAEVDVLGTVLLTDADLGWASTELAVEDFGLLTHQAIWESMLRIHLTGAPVDTINVCNDLRAVGDLGKAGGAAYVHSLPLHVDSAASFRDRVRVVAKGADTDG